MDMDLVGMIHPTSLPSLLYSACETRETGQLLLRRNGTEKSIYLKGGRIIFATSNNRDERLGHVLLRQGVIGVEQFCRATEESLRTKKRLGTVLVEYGWLEPEGLVRGVVQQVEEILFEAFEWPSGTYQLTLGDLPTQEVITLELNTGELMLEGIRHIRSWYRIGEALGKLDATFQKREETGELVARMPLAAEDRIVLDALAVPRTLRQIFQEFPGRDFELGQLLWTLQTLRIITRL